MKQGLYLAFVYIGLVIGAGFASGREIMEFFNNPSNTDQRGIVLATFLLIAVCYIILRRAYLWDIQSFDAYLESVAGRGAKPIRFLMLVFLFCGFFTMMAGSGALLGQRFMLPPFVGILAMLLLCFVVLSFDLRGVVALNLFLVPCMIVGILYVCVSSVIFGVAPVMSIRGVAQGTLASAICYVSYNTISAATVLVPLQRNITPRGICVAAVVGGFVLGLLLLVIWLCQGWQFDLLWDSELPMLKLAVMVGRTQKDVYTLILLMAICTTAVAQGFGILEQYNMVGFGKRAKAAGLLCLLALPFSLLGFSNLVAQLYALFGILGFGWMVWIFWDFYRKKPPYGR